MLLKEAISDIEYFLNNIGERVPDTGTLIEQINRSADFIAMELQFPTRYIKDLSATAAFSLPDEARSNGLYYVENSQTRNSVPMLSIEEANKTYPEWEDYLTDLTSAPFCFLLVDQKNESAGLTPFGFNSGDILNALYVKAIAKLDNTEDGLSSPLWGGELPEYHDLIVDRLMYRHLRLKKDASGTGFKADYERRLEEAYNYLMHDAHNPVSQDMVQRSKFTPTYKRIYNWR